MYLTSPKLAFAYSRCVSAVSKIEPSLARMIEDKLMELDWIFLPYSSDGSLSSLENTNDLGENSLNKNGFITLAARKGRTVRIDTYHKSNSEFDSRVAMYTHEAIYSATEAQGDKDSARAGEINALIWKYDPSGNSIREAWSVYLGN